MFLSLAQLCDAGMKIMLTKNQLIVAMDDESNAVMLEGTHTKSDGIWCIDLDNGDKFGDVLEAKTKLINVHINNLPTIKTNKNIRNKPDNNHVTHYYM